MYAARITALEHSQDRFATHYGKCHAGNTMATSSINVTLPAPLKDYVEAQAESGAFGTPSDFILDDRDRRRRNLEEHLLDALKHEEESVEISDEEWQSADLVEILRARLQPTL